MLLNYLLHLADNKLILGQRLGEWCGHGPVLEQDIAMTNIALDLVGQARLLYQYAAELDGNRSEDDFAFVRKEAEYLNVLLTEMPNGNFADTVVRQCFFDAFDYLLCDALRNCTDERIAGIAAKALKEVAYHRKWSSEWVVRLGDGTEESHAKAQAAVDRLWEYTGEFFVPAEYESFAQSEIHAPDVSGLQAGWTSFIRDTLDRATLEIPKAGWQQKGGKQGRHTEHLGYLLTELQYMQRTYPAMQW